MHVSTFAISTLWVPTIAVTTSPGKKIPRSQTLTTNGQSCAVFKTTRFSGPWQDVDEVGEYGFQRATMSDVIGGVGGVARGCCRRGKGFQEYDMACRTGTTKLNLTMPSEECRE